MEKYDYKRAIINELKDWIMNDTDIPEEGIMDGRDDDMYDWIYDEVWDVDAITGNGSYGYDTEEKCQEYVSTNLPLYFEAAREFDDLRDLTWVSHKAASHMDTTIRCYLLMDCIYEAIGALLAEGKIKHLTNE